MATAFGDATFGDAAFGDLFPGSLGSSVVGAAWSFILALLIGATLWPKLAEAKCDLYVLMVQASLEESAAIAKVVREPKVVEKKSFRQRVRKAMENFETQEHDLQAVTFFCWLKCKIQKRKYYSVLLEELNTEGDRFKIEKVLVKKQEGKSAVKKKSPKRA